MARHRAIQVGIITALMMVCYDSRYLLVNIDGGYGEETNAMIKPWQKMNGNIGSNLFLMNLKYIINYLSSNHCRYHLYS